MTKKQKVLLVLILAFLSFMAFKTADAQTFWYQNAPTFNSSVIVSQLNSNIYKGGVIFFHPSPQLTDLVRISLTTDQSNFVSASNTRMSIYEVSATSSNLGNLLAQSSNTVDVYSTGSIPNYFDYEFSPFLLTSNQQYSFVIEWGTDSDPNVSLLFNGRNVVSDYQDISRYQEDNDFFDSPTHNTIFSLGASGLATTTRIISVNNPSPNETTSNNVLFDVDIFNGNEDVATEICFEFEQNSQNLVPACQNILQNGNVNIQQTYYFTNSGSVFTTINLLDFEGAVIDTRVLLFHVNEASNFSLIDEPTLDCTGASGILEEFLCIFKDLMVFLFVGASDFVSQIIVNFKDTFLHKAPWGYAMRAYDIMFTSSTSTLPMLHLAIPSSVQSSIGRDVDIELDVFGAMADGITFIDETEVENLDGSPLDNLLYWWKLGLNIIIFLWFLRTLFGFYELGDYEDLGFAGGKAHGAIKRDIKGQKYQEYSTKDIKKRIRISGKDPGGPL